MKLIAVLERKRAREAKEARDREQPPQLALQGRAPTRAPALAHGLASPSHGLGRGGGGGAGRGGAGPAGMQAAITLFATPLDAGAGRGRGRGRGASY